MEASGKYFRREVFPQGQHTQAAVQSWPSLHLVRAAELGSMSHPANAGFEGVKGSWRAAEAWHCVAGLESLKRAQERRLVKMQP